MRCLLQRVRWGRVCVGAATVGKISRGLVILLGVAPDDTSATGDAMAAKIINLRIFNDVNDKMNLSLLDVAGECLVVSQFTLYADLSRGRRPYFGAAAAPQEAQEVYRNFVEALQQKGVKRVSTGMFGESMQVELCNDGPVTIWLDSTFNL